jgi:hypothetical protein
MLPGLERRQELQMTRAGIHSQRQTDSRSISPFLPLKGFFEGPSQKILSAKRIEIPQLASRGVLKKRGAAQESWGFF